MIAGLSAHKMPSVDGISVQQGQSSDGGHIMLVDRRSCPVTVDARTMPA